MNKFERAIELYENGDFETSYFLFEEYWNNGEKSLELLNYLGRCKTEMHDYETAIKYFEMAFELNPNSERIHFNLSSVYMRLKQFEIAEDLCKKALSLNKYSPDAWFYLGVLHERKEEWAKARDCYIKSIELDNPNENEEAHINLGGVYYELGEYDKSVQEEEIALKINPTSLEALFNKGLALKKKKLYTESKKAFNQIIELCPQDREAKKELERLENSENKDAGN